MALPAWRLRMRYFDDDRKPGHLVHRAATNLAKVLMSFDDEEMKESEDFFAPNANPIHPFRFPGSSIALGKGVHVLVIRHPMFCDDCAKDGGRSRTCDAI